MRPLIAEVRLDHFRHNYLLARSLHGGRALATVKANAYGHGVVACARQVADCADGYAVAFLEEALVLRDAGIRQPVVLLEGVFDRQELQEVERHGLWPVVQSQEQLAMLLDSSPRQPYHVWLKMDSGMHRAGFSPQEYRHVWQQLMSSGKVASIVKMTHFANADAPELPDTARQLRAFDLGTEGLAGDSSLANSAAVMVHKDAHRDWARPGIMLYGASPFADGGPAGLKPVMRLKSQVFRTRELAAGEGLGYGMTFVTQRPSRVGLVACGYADGYPRTAANGTPVAVDGVLTRLIGRVSMDMLMVDLTDIPSAGVGSEVELWGDLVGVNQVAAHAATLGYELLCNVKRAHFNYL
jgi:alanine racemase